MDLYHYLQARTKEIVDEAEQSLHRARLSHYEDEEAHHVHQRLKALLVLTARAVKDRNLGPMIAHADEVALERHNAGYDLAEVQAAFNVLEETLWKKILREFPPAEYGQALGMIGTILGSGKDALARRYVSLASRTRSPSLDLRSLFAGTDR